MAIMGIPNFQTKPCLDLNMGEIIRYIWIPHSRRTEFVVPKGL